MAFGWRYDPETQKFRKVIQGMSNVVTEAANAAVNDAASAGVKAGQQNIASAGFSQRWVRSLRYKMVTKKGDPVQTAYIHTTINYADVFERGANISGDPWLWIPLPSVPGGKGRAHMTPAQYVKNVGPLTLLTRSGKAPLLAAAIKRGAKAQPFGKFATKAQLKRGTKSKTGQVEMIPLFRGVHSVKIGKKWDVTGALQRETNKLPDYYEAELRRLDTLNFLKDG